MLSATLRSTPAGKSAFGGYTSTNLAVKSVSSAFEDAQSFTMRRPVTPMSFVSGGVWNTGTSFRAARGFVSEHSQKSSRHRWHPPYQDLSLKGLRLSGIITATSNCGGIFIAYTEPKTNSDF